MDKQQKQVMDSFVRVRVFLDALPTAGAPMGYASARETFDDVMQRLDEHAGAQARGSAQARAEQRRQEEQVALIVDRYMRPIVMVARAQVEPGADVGVPAAFRMPRLPLGPTRMLAACDAMIEGARLAEALFVAKGFPTDFLDRFKDARDALARARGNRAVQVGTHVAARAGLKVELRRGRRAVNQLDALVRAAFRGDEMTLTAWRVAKRVHHVPGGAGSRATVLEGDFEAAA